MRLSPSSLPPAFALLGEAVGLECSSVVYSFSGHWLAADPRGGALLIGEDGAALSKLCTDPQAREMRRRFTGHELAGKSWQIRDLFGEWDEIGTADSILYESDKVHGGGTGKPELFRHEFSQGAKAYRSGEFFAIVGHRIKVDAAGIRN